MASARFLSTGDYRTACKSKKDISKIIRKLRTSLGLTQEQFAANVGVVYSTVNRWENNKGKPSPLARLKIEELQNELKRNKRSK